jgi:hypothetical protein
METSQIMFDKGDVIELIASTRTNALLEKDPYLHGSLLISPVRFTFSMVLFWFFTLNTCYQSFEGGRAFDLSRPARGGTGITESMFGCASTEQREVFEKEGLVWIGVREGVLRRTYWDRYAW